MLSPIPQMHTLFKTKKKIVMYRCIDFRYIEYKLFILSVFSRDK